MTQQDKEQLKLEIDHIFESGANEIRIFEMVVNFIDRRNGVNKNFVLADVSGCFCNDCDKELSGDGHSVNELHLCIDCANNR